MATALCVSAWGYFLYQGVTDPLGGVNTLWPLFGISNQMLAAVALTLCTVVIFKMKRERYAWVTIVPTVWLAICTLTAGIQKIFHPDPFIGFLSHASRYSAALAQGQVLAPAKDAGQMARSSSTIGLMLRSHAFSCSSRLVSCTMASRLV